MDYQQYTNAYSGYQGYNPYGQYSGANHLKVGEHNKYIWWNRFSLLSDYFYTKQKILVNIGMTL